MLTESAQFSEAHLDAANLPVGGVPTAGLSPSEVYSLEQNDPELPAKIRANFKAVQHSKKALFSQLNSPWSETTDELFASFEKSVRHHLRVISEKMYVPVRRSLRIERSGSYERFKIFEERARKTNELIAVFLRKYHQSNEFFDAEFVNDVRTDMERVVKVLTEQLNRERAYLFPLYDTKN
ncbi:MAG: hypothetical protein KTR18_10910 [Acidiferrobacterales bacterium]|nr:hypothetical protein [Acidiferrobacterales bacterium]